MKRTILSMLLVTATLSSFAVKAQDSDALIDEATVVQSSTDLDASVEPVPVEDPNDATAMPAPSAAPMDEEQLPDDF